jgi:MSHA biogenesis protein MshQ
MKPRLQLKPKNKVTVKASIRLVYIGATFAIVVAVGVLIYSNFGTSKDSVANNTDRLPGFNYRKTISINKEIFRGNEVLYNFPMLICLKDADLKHVSQGGKLINLKAYDLRFTKKDGVSTLSSQIESYNYKTGEIKAWVMMDTLSDKIGHDLYVYYSNASINSELPPMLWMNRFEGVWHMNANVNADNTRKISTTLSGTNSAEGKCGMARQFSSERKDFASFNYVSGLDLKNSFTISAWVKLDEVNKKQIIVSNQGDTPGGYSMFIGENNRLNIDFINSAGKHINLDNSSEGEKLEKGKWYHLNAIYSQEDNQLRTYIDGISDRTASIIDAPAPTASSLQIGRNQFESNTYFSGVIDELRISSVARSQGWMATTFYNESLAEKLFKLGSTEELLLSSAEIKNNKSALQNNDLARTSQTEIENTMQAKKNPTNAQTPSALSSNTEVIQTRLNNIRRVSEQNK